MWTLEMQDKWGGKSHIEKLSEQPSDTEILLKIKAWVSTRAGEEGDMEIAVLREIRRTGWLLWSASVVVYWRLIDDFRQHAKGRVIVEVDQDDENFARRTGPAEPKRRGV